MEKRLHWRQKKRGQSQQETDTAFNKTKVHLGALYKITADQKISPKFHTKNLGTKPYTVKQARWLSVFGVYLFTNVDI